MQSGFDINQLLQEAQRRWLKPAEVLFILQNHEKYQITPEAPQRPPGGSLFLFNKRVLRFFRKDGHNWRKKKDGRTVGEAHERLKVGIAEAINCYYAHGEDNPSFQRRSYWMLDPAYEHIVLVHYRETSEGKFSPGSIADPSPGASATLSQSTSSFTVQNPGPSSLSESYQNHSSPGSLEVSSDASMAKGFDYLNGSNVAQHSSMMSESEVSQALRRLEMQLSLDDDSLKEYVPPDDLDGNEDKYCILDDYNSYPSASHSNGSLPQPDPGCNIAWDDVFGLPKDSQQLQLGGLDGKRAYVMNSSGNIASAVERPAKQENYQAQCVGANTGIEAPEDLSTLAYSSQMYPVSSELSMMLLDPSIGMPVAIDSSLTVAKDQRFTIRTISPEWGFANDSTKVIIVGSFLCEPSECTWHCMFGDVEVPLQVLQDGVFTCHAPSHLSGKVTLCITSGNRESCSEIKEFEYREKHSTCKHCDKREEETSRGTEEMLLLVRLVKMLLSDIPINRGGNNELEVDLCLKDEGIDNSWDQIMEALLVGGGSSTTTLDWLLQQLIKDKLQQWLSSHTTGVDSFLSRKEQGVIHMISGLGYEWALNPLLDHGVGVNFRDINGWTALHWAARFGREKMVAALIASGASALAVTDPSSNDPTGRNAAYIAAANGHKGLAGYLSEVALTSHLSSLTMEETELSKGTADVEAELTVNNISKESVNSLEDQVSLKHTLAAVRNAAQAAARIQAAFRAHSFRKRQQGEASGSGVDEYGFALNDTQEISAASKLAFHNLHYNHKAALSIQKNYRGWKGRKDFVSLRQKVVKIQAHVRGYQVRKKYKVICWAVGILDKAVLRWRRKGAGLRGYKPEVDCVNDEEDEDIIKVFRKEKVNVAIDEAVSRVLSMVDSPDARHQYQRMIGKFQEGCIFVSSSLKTLLEYNYSQFPSCLKSLTLSQVLLHQSPSLIYSHSHHLLSLCPVAMSIFEYNGSALVAMVGKNCFAIASDRRLGVQLQTVATDFQRIHQISDRLFIGLAGLATDSQTLCQRLNFRHKLYELREERSMKPETFASLVSAILYEKRFGPYFCQPVIAGLGDDDKPFICTMDSIGAKELAKDFVVAGTASESLYGACESMFKPDMEPEDLFETVSQALQASVDRDCLSGWGAHVYLVTPTEIKERILKGRMD